MHLRDLKLCKQRQVIVILIIHKVYLKIRQFFQKNN